MIIDRLKGRIGASGPGALRESDAAKAAGLALAALATNVLAGDLGDDPASWWCLGPHRALSQILWHPGGIAFPPLSL